ncbi:MAG: hypothetical protein ACOYD4_03250 [Solirubrobacterales bacterium]
MAETDTSLVETQPSAGAVVAMRDDVRASRGVVVEERIDLASESGRRRAGLPLCEPEKSARGRRW